MKIASYKELEAYKKGYNLVLLIYQITKNFPKEELYGITSQIRRAAISVPCNISEGYMRGSREYVQFLKIALGSSAELETLLSLSKDLGYCSETDFSKLYNLNLEIKKLLSTYISKITERCTLNAVR